MEVINLLPSGYKKQIRAARFNIDLRKYVFVTAFFGGLILVIYAISFWLLVEQKNAAIVSKTRTDASLAQFSDVRKTGESFIKNVGIAKKILDGDLVFSKLIVDLAALVPKGVIMSNLSLGTATLDAPLDMSARAANYDAAVRFKNNLENSSLFENVTITSLTSATSASGTQPTPLQVRYPINVSISAKFTRQTGVRK